MQKWVPGGINCETSCSPRQLASGPHSPTVHHRLASLCNLASLQTWPLSRRTLNQIFIFLDGSMAYRHPNVCVRVPYGSPPRTLSCPAACGVSPTSAPPGRGRGRRPPLWWAAPGQPPAADRGGGGNVAPRKQQDTRRTYKKQTNTKKTTENITYLI